MILNLNPTLLSIIVGTPLLLLIMFLPALIELKKPKDSGPRLIMDEMPEFQVQPRLFVALANLEEEAKFEVSLLPRLMRIIEVLPSLEV